MKITFISDTHNKHKVITDDLPGGDLLIHAGDLSSMGYEHEITEFCKWYDKLNNYDTKVFIAGNHDWGFQDDPEKALQIVNSYKTIDYLQDDLLMVGEDYDKMVKIWGSPWQPEFYNWAFNLPRNGEELKSKWDMIIPDVDILVTHGPAWGYVDKVIGNPMNLGCELLGEKIKTIKPKIHVCGHIHSGFGYMFDGDTHYFNAAVLGERYTYENKPMTVEWNPETNEIEFL
jgi:Icc-related predicted phosphoesterase